MTINELKITFQEALSSIYPNEEIDSFFFILMEEKLGLKRVDLILNPDKKIDAPTVDYFKSVIEKLKNEIPIQYIIGHTAFFGLDFIVDENVLIPRQETEELVDWIIKSADKKEPLKILDIGTGSGCIAISLAENIPNASVFAIDVSKEALNMAKQNAQKNEVKINFINESILTLKKLEQKFDIIVSNPPYIRELEKHEIKNNVLDNEPHLALFVEDDNPLLFYDAIADFSKNHLKKNGLLFFEINQYLGKETLELVKSKGFLNTELKKDLNNNDRMIKAF